MNREFTKREKILLVVLCVLLICVGYYKLILEPIENQILMFDQQTEAEQAQIDKDLLIVARIREMETEVSKIKESGLYRPIPGYDNSRGLMVELHAILAQAGEYALNFGAVRQTGYVAARPISMNFRTVDYDHARAIIDALHDSDNLNQISDLNFAVRAEGDSPMTEVSLTITYFEVCY